MQCAPASFRMDEAREPSAKRLKSLAEEGDGKNLEYETGHCLLIKNKPDHFHVG